MCVKNAFETEFTSAECMLASYGCVHFV